MGSLYHAYLFSLFVMLVIFNIDAMKFEVINEAKGTDVGSIFESKITESYAVKVMKSAYDLVHRKVYKLDNPFQKHGIDKISLFVEEKSSSSYQSNGFLITGEYLKQTDLSLIDFDKRIYASMTALFVTMDKDNKFPQELTEAVVKFILLEAGYMEDNWAKPGEGNTWYESSGVTAQFFKYCDTQQPEFVAKLIKNLKILSTSYLKENVDPFWKPYKKLYCHSDNKV